MAGVSLLNKELDGCMDLPPGFRFHPTDEEIITNYLSVKVITPGFTARAIGEVDLNKCEPWELPSKAKMGEKEWYFFCHKDRKYPTGMRANRATEAGYWKATGKDKEIYRGKDNLVGMKKTLVFYKGRAPKGEKTNWVIHEFRLEGAGRHDQQYDLIPRSTTNKDEWVVCKVFHKAMGAAKTDIWVGKDEAFSPKDHGHNISMYSTDQQTSTLPVNYSNINQQESSSLFLPQIPVENPYNMGYFNQDQYSMFDDSSNSFKGFNEVRNYHNDESTSSAFPEHGMCGFQSFAEFGGTSSAGTDFNVQWKY